MANRKKVSDEVIIKLYSRLKNVWKVGKEVGICGQSVHERLIKLGINKKRDMPKWKTDKIKKLYKEGFVSGDGSIEKLCKDIGVSNANVSRYARKLGLSNIHRKSSEKVKNDISKMAKKWIIKKGHPKGHLRLKHSEKTK